MNRTAPRPTAPDAGAASAGAPSDGPAPARDASPRSLRTRLAAGVLALVLLMAALMGAFSTLTLRHTLMDRLDEQLEAASERAATRRHGVAGLKDGQCEQAAGTATDATTVCKTSDGAPDGAVGPFEGTDDADDTSRPLPPGLDAAGQSTGTLSVISSGAREDGTDATDVESTVRAGYIDATGTYQSLSDTEVAELLALEPTGRPVTVSVGSLGDYRVVVTKDESTGDLVVTGLSMEADNALVRTQLLIELGIAVVGALVAAAAGRGMVRSSMAPLERVAATAQRVASQPLSSGEVSIDERVSEEDLASSQEVGQVGAALNTLLGHVDSALAARQRSETQVRQFVADASHELRTPLASIRGYTELIQREGADVALPEESLHALQRVHSESVRMTGLVEDLLLLARLDAGRELHHEEVDLLGLLLDTVADARAAGPGHEWELDLSDLDGWDTEESGDVDDAEPPVVVGDEARLRQVVVNLLANARVHTPEGSRVLTRLSREAAPAVGTPTGEAGGVHDAGGQPATGWWVVTISDDGPGIDPAVRDRLFERFARGDASRERRTGSTGLGMAIALAIVNSHHGSLTVSSAPAAQADREDAPASGTAGGVAGDAGGRAAGSTAGELSAAALRRGALDGWAREHGTTFTVRLPAGSAAPDA